MRDDKAFLFNLTSSRIFPSTNSGADIICSLDYGPTFSGGEGLELSAFNNSFIKGEDCCSFANLPGYKIGFEKDGITNLLTRKRDGVFKISELEVWSLKHH